MQDFFEHHAKQGQGGQGNKNGIYHQGEFRNFSGRILRRSPRQ
jgi:hypothetical protein